MCNISGIRRKCPRCRLSFTICSSCFRNQRYCSRECSKVARSQNRKMAQRRYDESNAGKLHHRWRQNRYRKRIKLQKNVTHHTSILKKSYLIDTSQVLNINQNRKLRIKGDPTTDLQIEKKGKRISFDLGHCHLCGKRVRWLKNRGDGF